MIKLLACLALLLLTSPLAAKDSLGVFGGWAAFRDPSAPRCYAIAMPAATRQRQELEPFATIGTWPRRNLRGQVHFRLARQLRPGSPVVLEIGGRTFNLTGGGGDAWAQDRKMDVAILAAMRSAGSMTIRATDRGGNRFSSTYALDGAATAMDAATVGCTSRR